MPIVQINNTYEVPDTDIKAVIETAAYGAINYWCAEGEVFEDARVWRIVEEEDGTELTLHYDAIAEAMGKIANGETDVGYPRAYVQQYFEALGDPLEAEYAAGFIDADAADAIIQITAFGELVYG